MTSSCDPDIALVQTNENQYTESEGILLSLETFGDATETTWAKFTNVLQKHYLAATKQDRQTPRRPLSNQDFLYIYNAKFTANTGKLPRSWLPTLNSAFAKRHHKQNPIQQLLGLVRS